MPNNHVQIKVGGINPQLADLIIRMFLFIFYTVLQLILNIFASQQKAVLFAKESEINCYTLSLHCCSDLNKPFQVCR